MTDQGDSDAHDTPIHGFRSDLDGTFGAAEPRIRARIAGQIDSAGAPVDDHGPSSSTTSSDPLHALPVYRPSTTSTDRPRRRVAVLGLVIVAAVTVAAVLLVRSDGTQNRLRDAAAGARASTDRFDPDEPVDISASVLERRGTAVVGYDVVTSVLPSGDAYGGTLGEAVVAGEPSGVALAPMATGPMERHVFGGFAFDEIADLPTEPRQLATAVAARAEAEPDSPETARALTTLAAIPAVPRDVRGAALLALGSIATSDPLTGTDPLGRPGTVVTGTGWAVIVDEPTGQVLAFAGNPTTSNPSSPADADTWTMWR